jgi:hypothetical protein
MSEIGYDNSTLLYKKGVTCVEVGEVGQVASDNYDSCAIGNMSGPLAIP